MRLPSQPRLIQGGGVNKRTPSASAWPTVTSSHCRRLYALLLHRAVMSARAYTFSRDPCRCTAQVFLAKILKGSDHRDSRPRQFAAPLL